ncbi:MULTISPECIES: NADP-dependent oxidoreductase [Streptomyces]|jgi:NADPH:quinone reductase-like Zn-dependent oxidoreductase|uniref:NADP-dependent oxidoreductase n=2 Tax=Streptomyces griseoaurantiacus TaxID=68213 RepID=A0A7W2DXY8_9ACTN|nr:MULTISPECIES: NADP-dependent oxidoreductase [Streptomyces]MBA5224931.1 NADP-dependent oxidoreductase [Streptomyces griseoaurantiacus]MDX3088639.1 NADP-dependent oxidoreductase [Streptomyces sp. ME12-02E]MDX3331845.1 NADP-dependent oxidoreductase [Streptomyces sp. ME02-6978a]MDX3358535.1 NADP-dependent oxidoreductase [Streptomyces sp. ME02-6978.2a]WTI24945.1 NADP-dependent oxidoreductase [Streptomyces jietaisiensis]
MRAARYHEYGGVETLVVEQAPDPHPGPGEIRIRVAAASVNPVDWKVRSGAVREVLPVDLPAVPGRDAAGVVDEIGEGVRGVGVGDRVFGLGGVTGATAEFAVLSAWARTPDTWSDEEAAAAALGAVTAMGGLNALGPLKGRTVLIEGAAGGVGSAAVEIAVAQGATVIGTAGERNHEFLTSLGAVPTTYGAGLAERVATLAPDGVDVVLDTAASGSLADLVALVGDPARVSTVADHANAQRLGVHVANAENDPALLAEAAELGRLGHFTPRVEATYPLERIAEAHAHSERGHTRGKIVVRL